MAEHQTPSNGIVVREETVGDLLADQRDLWRIRGVGVREIAAANERDTECREVAGAHAMQVGMRPLADPRQRHAFEGDVGARVVARERHAGAERGGLDAGQGPRLGQQSRPERADGLAVLVPRRRQRHLHRQQTLGPEARIHGHQAQEAAGHQAGANQEEERQRDLERGEGAAETLL